MDTKVVAEARNFLRMMRSAVAFAEEIDRIGSLDTDLNSVREEHRKNLVVIDAQRTLLATMKMEQAQILETIETAKAEARRIVKDAKEKAEIAATAKLKAADADSAEILRKARDEASAWDHRASVVQAEFTAMKKELADVEAKLSITKDSLKKLFEGVQHGSL